MKWFSAVVVMECRVSNRSADLWDEQVHLIRAQSPEDAYKAARQLGKESETRYRNSAGEPVRWRFAGVGELEELLAQRIESGIEVYSKLTRKAPARVPKEKLIVFWSRRNRDRTAAELLDKPLKRRSPR